MGECLLCLMARRAATWVPLCALVCQEHNGVDTSTMGAHTRGATAAIQDVDAVCDEVLESTVTE
jgi:hypothetical protein